MRRSWIACSASPRFSACCPLTANCRPSSTRRAEKLPNKNEVIAYSATVDMISTSSVTLSLRMILRLGRNPELAVATPAEFSCVSMMSFSINEFRGRGPGDSLSYCDTDCRKLRIANQPHRNFGIIVRPRSVAGAMPTQRPGSRRCAETAASIPALPVRAPNSRPVAQDRLAGAA